MNEKPHKPCHCEICIADRYWQPCSGCKDGHPSFWKTVIESPQWKLWQKEQMENPGYDMPEVEELGNISPKHFQDFLQFTFNSRLQSIKEEVEKLDRQITPDFSTDNKKHLTDLAVHDTVQKVLTILNKQDIHT